MTITTDHLNHMRAAIVPLDTPERREAYRTGNFPRADKVKDLNTRYRYDLLYASGLNPWLCSTVYSYANDTHIATALKAIVPQL
jgi:hypothetical protein